MYDAQHLTAHVTTCVSDTLRPGAAAACVISSGRPCPGVGLHAEHGSQQDAAHVAQPCMQGLGVFA
jgi:hypothetical protein